MPDKLDESSALLRALTSLPLFDDPYLRMQATNIAMVNDYLVELERSVFEEYMETDHIPKSETIFTSAISQMWIFSLYELLRTWRQRIQEALRHRAESDSACVCVFDAANKNLEQVFRAIEGVRVTLAKHEVPKCKGVKAENVGYARIDPLTGSMTYFYLDKDGSYNDISRDKIVQNLLKATGR